MLSAIRKRLTYPNVAMTLALVFAMTGGAYAANHYLITSTKQISPKVLKALKGANGKNGAPGPAGPAGAAGSGTAGAQGPTGPAGAKGETGAAGAAGANGEAGAKGANGTNGTTGFTSTLPSGKTETGAWFAESNASKVIHFAISFPIPLEAPITATANTIAVTRKQVEEGKVPAGCSGSAVKPEAAPGNVCLFEGGEEAALAMTGTSVFTPPSVPGGATGLIFASLTSAANETYRGTWAVTAP
jgi:hypothetical protein